jgi:hypothetical protein
MFAGILRGHAQDFGGFTFPERRDGVGGGLQGIGWVRVGADCQSSAYSAYYSPSDLWIADGLR